MMKQFKSLLIALSLSVICRPALAIPTVDWAAAAAWATQHGDMLVQYEQTLQNRVISDATTQMAALKVTLAHKAVAEGIAEWQAKEKLRQQGVQAQHALEQPATTCVTASAASNTPAVDASLKASVHSRVNSDLTGPRTLGRAAPNGTAPVLTPPMVTDNAAQQVVQTYDYVMSNFCSPAEVAAKRCGGYEAAASASPVPYPGGDMRGDLLFGDSAGNETMMNDAPGQTNSVGSQGGQAAAVDAFINNVVDSMPPEVLRNPAWAQTPAGREYVLKTRQYLALQSLVKNSFATIRNNHIPITGLGTTMGVSGPNTQFPTRIDISRMEAADLFVKTKWSAASIQDLATAVEPHKILRDLAMMSAYRLWLDFQSLSSAERQEALLAAQLSVMTRQAFEGPLAALKRAATASGNASGS